MGKCYAEFEWKRLNRPWKELRANEFQRLIASGKKTETKKKENKDNNNNNNNRKLQETGASKWLEHCHVFTWPYAIDFISTKMVRIRARGNLRMRNQNTKTKVPLDVVPERCTERFPPRFRLVSRFCELRLRYLSSPTGREGEISRPLDHMKQIPFILSTDHPQNWINTSIHIMILFWCGVKLVIGS